MKKFKVESNKTIILKGEQGDLKVNVLNIYENSELHKKDLLYFSSQFSAAGIYHTLMEYKELDVIEEDNTIKYVFNKNCKSFRFYQKDIGQVNDFFKGQYDLRCHRIYL